MNNINNNNINNNINNITIIVKVGILSNTRTK